jgi:hypothetical protein
LEIKEWKFRKIDMEGSQRRRREMEKEERRSERDLTKRKRDEEPPTTHRRLGWLAPLNLHIMDTLGNNQWMYYELKYS